MPEVAHLAVDGCTTKAPCGGQVAGPSPVDRRRQGLKRSLVTDAGGIPLGVVAPAANRRDDGLLAATLDTLAVVAGLPERPMVHLDAGYDYQTCRQVLAEHGMAGQIATRGLPTPVQASRRWPVERTHAWGNQYGKLRWCTERRRVVVEFWLALAGAAIVRGRLVVARGPATAGTAGRDPLLAQPLSRRSWQVGGGSWRTKCHVPKLRRSRIRDQDHIPCRSHRDALRVTE